MPDPVRDIVDVVVGRTKDDRDFVNSFIGLLPINVVDDDASIVDDTAGSIVIETPPPVAEAVVDDRVNDAFEDNGLAPVVDDADGTDTGGAAPPLVPAAVPAAVAAAVFHCCAVTPPP